MKTYAIIQSFVIAFGIAIALFIFTVGTGNREAIINGETQIRYVFDDGLAPVVYFSSERFLCVNQQGEYILCYAEIITTKEGDK